MRCGGRGKPVLITVAWLPGRGSRPRICPIRFCIYRQYHCRLHKFTLSYQDQVPPATDSRSFRFGVNIFSRCVPAGRPNHSCPRYCRNRSLLNSTGVRETITVPLLCVRSKMLKYWAAGTLQSPIPTPL